jgi:hypothetical protein
MGAQILLDMQREMVLQCDQNHLGQPNQKPVKNQEKQSTGKF